MKIEALILNLYHQALMPVKAENPLWSAPNFEALNDEFRSRGLPLPAPSGVQPPRYLFLFSSMPPAPAMTEWVSLPQLARRSARTGYWSYYTDLLLGFEPPARDLDVFSFGNTPAMAAHLGHMVVRGRKRATSGNPEALVKSGLTVPRPGLVSIVTDGFGFPLACIETERVDRHLFKAVPAAVATGEGEGDLSLAEWRRGHWDYFTAEAQRLGIVFTEDSELITEWFRLIQKA